MMKRRLQSAPHPFAVGLQLASERARQTEAFAAGLAAVRAVARSMSALAVLDPEASVKDLRERGGITKILSEAFLAAVGDASVPGPMGKPYEVRCAMPLNLRDILMDEMKKARKEAQS